MAGIYIHIPFCKQACNYCDFHFSTSLKNKEAFLSSLKIEIELQKKYLSKEEETSKISTIYFGGGTPSLLSAAELMRVFDTLDKNFEIDNNAEITLEANPDDLTKQKIKELKSTVINRFSIGIQSFYDADLKLMNRAHSSQEAISAVKGVQDAGFENITIDLIYGIPTLTNHNWRNNLQNAFLLDVKHISAYCLTVEPKTVLAHQVKTGKIKNVDEQQSAEQFEIMIEGMKQNKFIQYEISNFCKDGFFSKHNSNYWLKEKYLGLGPSAHSFDGENRQWNVSNNALYISSLEKGQLNFEKEELTEVQRYNEYVMTSLRTMWGVSLDYIQQNYGSAYVNYFLEEAKKYMISEDVLNDENKLYLTDKGKLIADKIASDLFKIE
ncbi:MAG: radical SAM family heme chaperone HemW [Bacteroidia bacterium]|nr:radical SAM family heme chaperone HemW [Bacteroidia bacterium]